MISLFCLSLNHRAFRCSLQDRKTPFPDRLLLWATLQGFKPTANSTRFLFIRFSGFRLDVFGRQASALSRQDSALALNMGRAGIQEGRLLLSQPEADRINPLHSGHRDTPPHPMGWLPCEGDEGGFPIQRGNPSVSFFHGLLEIERKDMMIVLDGWNLGPDFLFSGSRKSCALPFLSQQH
jgi:hypothetical protein